jgi:hypothetical protein
MLRIWYVVPLTYVFLALAPMAAYVPNPTTSIIKRYISIDSSNVNSGHGKEGREE